MLQNEIVDGGLLMKYKMIALDLDGTLTNSKKEVSEYTKRILIELQEQGGIVVITTGRPIQGAIPIAKILELDVYGGYILSFNGGLIINCKTGQEIFKAEISNEFVSRLGDSARKYQVPILTYAGDEIITEDTTDKYVRLEAGINHMPVKALYDFKEEVTFPVPKCLMVADGWYLENVLPKMQKEFGEYLNIFRSEPFFMEVMPLGVDKASGLKRILEVTGIGREELIACGDGFNDVSMIEFAGLGVAMENAQDAVKAIADEITDSNDDDGVARIVEKYMKN